MVWRAEEAYFVPKPTGVMAGGGLSLDEQLTVCCRSSHGLQAYDHCSSGIISVPCCLWKESLQTNPCHCGVIPALLIPGLFWHSFCEVLACTDQCLVESALALVCSRVFSFVLWVFFFPLEQTATV